MIHKKLLSLLVLLMTAASGAWADIDLKDIVWKPGDTFNIGGKWFYRDNSSPGTKFLATNADGTVPDFVISSNCWYLEDIISASNAVAQNSGTVYFSNPLPLSFVMPEGKTSSNKPMGFKIASGDGTQDSPYMFGLVYPDVEVTTNKATGATTFTEAEFDMPDFDATVDYELVRDMAIDMPVTVGDGNDGYRIRLKKEGTSFVPAEMTPQQMAGLIVVKDDIEEKTLTNVTDYTVQIFAVDAQDEPTGNAIAFQSLTPGRYVAIASAADGSIYDGKTQQSNVFVLFQGYEVTVPAGEYVTYYRNDDNLVLDGESTGAKLYTITEVSGSTATATEITSANKEMPFLVYNSNEEAKTFLLIPTETETNQAFYAGFIGTAEATTIAASDASANRYAFNGKQFVWVKNAIAVGANKAWLQISNTNARTITLVFDDVTKITNTNITNITNGNWYDLNGRKLQGVPTKKGVYIMNGRKVVVR